MREKKAMSAAYKAQVEKIGTPISNELYRELREYSQTHKIRISGFRNYAGNIETIKTVIDDICEIASDFPAILDERLGVVLELDYDMREGDFATTDSGHVIHLNAGLFCNLQKLQKEYKEAMVRGDFVAGTDWRAVTRHEIGHVVEFFYGFNIIQIAIEILEVKRGSEVLDIVKKDLSDYAALYLDGREVIAECFSGYYGRVGNKIADAFVARCIELRDEKTNTSADRMRGDIMRANDEALYWMKNDSWSRVDRDRDCLELTPEAPQRAVDSFRLYLLRNDLPVEEGVIPGSALKRRDSSIV